MKLKSNDFLIVEGGREKKAGTPSLDRSERKESL